MKRSNKEMPKFIECQPNDLEEKHIVALKKDLWDVFKAYVELNCHSMPHEKFFLILRDAAIAFNAYALGYLCTLVSNKEQVPLFTEEAHDIFCAYLKKIEAEYKDKQ